MYNLPLLLAAVVSYLIGSIPFGLILSKMMGKGDLRQQGSGNIGATNAHRVGGKTLGSLTLFCDMLKGVVAVLLINYWLGAGLQYVAAAFVVIGHIFPIFLKFRGGKGVATTLAVVTVLSLNAGLTMVGLWLITYYFSRISSLSAIVSIIFTTLIACVYMRGEMMMLLCLFTALIVMRHRDNINRMVSGTER